MTMLSLLRALSSRAVVPQKNGVQMSCILCSGFSNSSWPVESNAIKNTRVSYPCRVPEVGLRRGVHPPGVLLFNYQPHRFAGHSKWANIKHVKTANDQAKSRDLAKYVNYIKVAVREHGSADPKQNSRLAQIILQVKEAKLPMAAIDRTLQTMQAQKDSKQCIVPIKGPGNCIMLIDLESSQLQRSKSEVNTILRKNKAILASESVLYMFDHKGLLLCSELDGKAVSEELLDNATEHAIEAGASDVKFHEDYPEFERVLEFITEPSAFFKVKGALESFKYTIVHAEVAYIPKQTLELSDEDMELVNKLYNKLTEHQDVQKVYANIA